VGVGGGWGGGGGGRRAVGGRRGMAVWGNLVVASDMGGHLAALLPCVSRMRGAKAQ
jgi:hypothetical protein